MPGTPVNTRKPDERKLNFWERLFFPEIFKGLGYSFRKIVKEPMYTLQYPDDQWTPPDSFRGRPVLVEEAGRPRCVSCNLCARACPPMAISMQSTEIADPGNPKEREPAWFEINMLRCILCGFCEEVCPEEAIVMSKEYDMIFQNRAEAVFGLERLLVPKALLKDRLDYLAQVKNPQFGAEWDFQEQNNLHSLRDRHFLRYLLEEEGVTELLRTHLRPDAPVGTGREWGGVRSGPEAAPYAAPTDAHHA